MIGRQRRRSLLANLLWGACATGWILLIASHSAYIQRAGGATAILSGLLAALRTSLNSQAQTRAVVAETLAANERVNEHLNDCAMTIAIQQILSREQPARELAAPAHARHRRPSGLTAGGNGASVVPFPTRKRNEAS